MTLLALPGRSWRSCGFGRQQRGQVEPAAQERQRPGRERLAPRQAVATPPGTAEEPEHEKHSVREHPHCGGFPDYLTSHSFARLTQTISLSLRTKTHLLAKAGWLQTTLRPKAALVGSRILARLISS